MCGGTLYVLGEAETTVSFAIRLNECRNMCFQLLLHNACIRLGSLVAFALELLGVVSGSPDGKSAGQCLSSS